MPRKKISHFTLFLDEVLRPEKSARGESATYKELIAESFLRFPRLPIEVQEHYKSRATELKNANLAAEFFPQVRRQPVAENSAFKAVDLNAENKRDEIVARNVHQRISKFTSKKDLMEKEFIFASVQCFLNTEPHVRPVEIAMVKWNMDKGIIDQFSELVHPGEIPLGLRASLNEFAAATHKFNEDMYALGTQDYGGLWARIMKFITYGRMVEPVYSFQPLSCRLVSLCLNWLNDQVSRNRVEISVDPVENLYKELLECAGKNVDIKFGKEFLSRFNFDISDSLRCSFHVNHQCEFCALAFCLKPIYNMLSSLQSCYSFELTKNHKQLVKVVVSTDNANVVPVRTTDLLGRQEGEELRKVSFRKTSSEQVKVKLEPQNAPMEVSDVSIDGCPAPSIALDFPDENQWPKLGVGRASNLNQSGVAWGKPLKMPPGVGRGRGRFL